MQLEQIGKIRNKHFKDELNRIIREKAQIKNENPKSGKNKPSHLKLKPITMARASNDATTLKTIDFVITLI
ncbi:hypothetical protein B7991_01285 [Fibrobacter sp. UWB3]|nr:hypothetical protein B7991_01285 [Fibrobacter sp. UWB3]